MSEIDQKDLRALDNGLVLDGGRLVIGHEDTAQRLRRRGWVEEPEKHGKIDYAVWVCEITPMGEMVRDVYNPEKIGYEGYPETPKEFLDRLNQVTIRTEDL